MSELKPCPFCGRNHGLLITSVCRRLDDIAYTQWSVFCDASGDKVGCGASCGYHHTKEQAIEAWNRRAGDVPTIEPERKKGKWKRRLVDGGFNADWHCSECGWRTSLEEHGYNFCPNCGSDLRGDPDD